MKSKFLHTAKEYLFIVLGGVMYAFGVYYFIYANNFTSGGVAGVVEMICHLINNYDCAGYINFAINVPLIVIAFFALDKEFALKTTVNVLAVSITLTLLPNLGLGQYEVNGDVGKSILAALFGGAIGGVTLALVLKVNGCTGGADVVGAFISKKNPACSVQWGIFLTNAVIIGISVFVYSVDVNTWEFTLTPASFQPIMLALIYQFMNSKVCDMVMQGAKVALKFEVVTDHPEELSDDLIKTLKHGVTVVPAVGMYEHQSRHLLICIVKKSQIEQFKCILKKYPDAFAYVAQVNEIIGSFNR